MKATVFASTLALSLIASAASAQARFSATNGSDPLFRLVDGATCPTAAT